MLSLILNKRHEDLEPSLCSEPVHIPLTAAYVCLDCNSVGNCAMQCPACASTMLMGLAGVLNREVDAVAEQVVEEMDYKYVPVRRLSALEEVAA